MSNGIIYTSSINQVSFSTQDQKSIRLDSAVPVTTYDLFKGSIPYPQGPYDPHMGPSDNGYPCSTCQNTKKLCLGHEGHTVLRYPVQAPLFMSEIKKWLRLICFKCGASVVEPHEYSRIPNVVFKSIDDEFEKKLRIPPTRGPVSFAEPIEIKAIKQ